MRKAVHRLTLIIPLVCLTLLLPLAGAAQGSAQQLFFDAFELLKGGKTREAATKFEAGLAKEPNNAAARFYLGEAYLASGQKDKAREQFRKSLELEAGGPVAEQARKRLGELSGNVFAAGGAAPAIPAAGTAFRDCPQCPEMVVIPAGQFVMGSAPSEAEREDDEGPPHLVTIGRAFALGKYEVTFAEWDACVQDRACAQVSDEGWGRGRRPVINVTYVQAIGFTEWLSDKTGKKYRLPSEAEWEYAARAGSERARYWGSSPDRACQFANVGDQAFKRKRPDGILPIHDCDDGYPETAPVGSFKPNDFGLYDMLGNVWEWVEDCYNQSYQGAPSDGRVWATGDCSRRVLRGGSWVNSPRNVRSAFRDRFEPADRVNGLGFRVARTLP